MSYGPTLDVEEAHASASDHLLTWFQAQHEAPGAYSLHMCVHTVMRMDLFKLFALLAQQKAYGSDINDFADLKDYI